MNQARWLSYDPPFGPSQWLVIERQDGQLEDKGFVEFTMQMPVVRTGEPLDLRHRLLARQRDPKWSGGILLEEDERELGTSPDPLVVRMPDGEEQVWHIGAAARRKALERGLLTPAVAVAGR